jgi:peptidoglycan/LPS O-acetylase OafA/YrhL
VFGVAFYVLCLAAFQDGGPLPGLFSWTPLRWFGNMSYSFFLLHGLMLKCAFFLLANIERPTASATAMYWLLLPAVFLAALLPSVLLFFWIEKPFSLAQAPSIGSPTAD